MPEKANAAAAPANPLSNITAADLQVILAPLNKFLTDLQQPNVNFVTVLQEFNNLQLAELQNGPQLEAIGIGGLAAYLQQQINTWANNIAPPTAGGGQTA